MSRPTEFATDINRVQPQSQLWCIRIRTQGRWNSSTSAPVDAGKHETEFLIYPTQP